MSQLYPARSKSNGASSPESFNRMKDDQALHAIWHRDLIVPRMKYVAWRIVTLVAFATLYAFLVSEGYRIIFPTLARKLYTLPFLAFFRNYEDTHRIDLAVVMAIVLMFSVVFLWERLLELFIIEAPRRQYLSPDEFAKQSPENLFFVVVGTVILACDGILFYLAVCSLSWGGVGFSFTALLATVAWIGIILTICHVSNKLRHHAFPEE